ncbi:MAG: HAD family hydrolase [Caldisericia bacterium]
MKYLLIDLDKTLLEIDFDEFLKSYFSLLIPKLKKIIIDKDPLTILNISVDYMINEKNGELNITKFYNKFTELSGIDIEEAKNVFLEFYINDFPKLSTFGKPAKNGKETIIKLIGLGYKIVLATNSIFPEIAIYERMKWANVDDINFTLVTTMENMHFAKPHSEYYLEILEKINVKISDVLMVGDDLNMDILPAKKIGIKTIHFGFDIKDISEIVNLL